MFYPSNAALSAGRETREANSTAKGLNKLDFILEWLKPRAVLKHNEAVMLTGGEPKSVVYVVALPVSCVIALPFPRRSGQPGARHWHRLM